MSYSKAGAVLAVLLVNSVGALAASPASPPEPAAKPAPPAANPSPIETARQAAVAAGVKITELKRGKGNAVFAGADVRVHYTGWFFDRSAPEGKGAKFDSSRDRGQPFTFALGRGEVIAGWDLGVAGMQPGGQRRLVVPPEAGYGASGTPGGPIPPNATLVFDVELIDFKSPP